MLPDVNFDTYKQYKSGTKQVIQWLAHKVSYKITNSSKSSQRSNEIRIPSHDLPQLARQAVSLDSPSGIPRQILTTLQKVVSARRACSAVHSERAGTAKRADKRSNRTHEHFVGVLENVFRILSGSHSGAAKQPEDEAPKFESADSVASLTTQLDSLGVQGSIQDFLSETEDPLASSTKAKAAAPRYEVETSDHEIAEEALFASFCFLQDCYRLRTYLRTLWQDYRDRQVSLTVASITTNVAFDAIRRLHRDFSDRCPGYATYEALDDFILANPVLQEITEEGALIPTLRARSKSGDRYDFNAPLPGREIYSVLKHFRDAYRVGQVKSFDSEWNAFDWSDICLHSQPPRLQNLIQLIISRLVPDMVILMDITRDSTLPADELSCEVRKFRETTDISVTLVLTCEIFVDIHYVLQSDLGRAFTEYKDSAEDALLSMRKHDMYTSIVGYDRSVKKTRDNFAALKGSIEWIPKRDVITEYRRAPVFARDSLTHALISRNDLTPFCLLKHHPTLSGMLRFHYNRTMCYGGIRVANEWGCMMSVIHLYNAVRQCGYLEQEWSDIEAIIEWCGPEHLFVGTPPTTFKDFGKRYALATGIRPAAFAPNADWKNYMRISKHSVRTITYAKSVQEYGKREPGMVLHDAEIAIGGLHKSYAAQSDDVKRILDQWRDHRILTPLDLLKVIRVGITEEELHLHLDFLAMHRRCTEFCRRLRDRLAEEFPSMRNADLFYENKWLYGVATLVLASAADLDEEMSVKVGAMVVLQPNQIKVDSLHLKFVAQLMAPLIEREGAKEIERARRLCYRT